MSGTARAARHGFSGSSGVSLWAKINKARIAPPGRQRPHPLPGGYDDHYPGYTRHHPRRLRSLNRRHRAPAQEGNLYYPGASGQDPFSPGVLTIISHSGKIGINFKYSRPALNRRECEIPLFRGGKQPAGLFCDRISGAGAWNHRNAFLLSTRSIQEAY